jgi:hypothetical protein
VVAEVARAILAGDRAGAARLLPESLRPSIAPVAPLPPTTRHRVLSASAPAPVALMVPAASVAPPAAVEPMTPAAVEPMTPAVVAAVATPVRRYAMISLAGLAVGVLAMLGVRAATRGGEGERVAAGDTADAASAPVGATIDAGAAITLVADAPVPVTAVDAGAAVVPSPASGRLDAGAARNPLRVDASPARMRRSRPRGSTRARRPASRSTPRSRSRARRRSTPARPPAILRRRRRPSGASTPKSPPPTTRRSRATAPRAPTSCAAASTRYLPTPRRFASRRCARRPRRSCVPWHAISPRSGRDGADGVIAM